MEGLKQKYILKKTNGKSIDPKAKYFVIRYDEGMKDKAFLRANRRALIKFTNEIFTENEKLSLELRSDITQEMLKR